jgi:hypothetical protein
MFPGGVQKYEPRGQPPNGVSLSLISGSLAATTSSGLNTASLRWQVDGMVYLPFHLDPPENIDAILMNAAGGYCEALCAQFTLGGLVRMIDVFGSEGERLSATAGYLEQDKKLYRVNRLIIPLIINSKWTLTP